jgi:predicted transcriptional regulator with HTH domain
MNQQQIKSAISGISKLLGSNPELLAKQLAGLKTLLPGLNEAAITGILEKTKTTGFNPHQMEEELEHVVEAVKSAEKK